MWLIFNTCEPCDSLLHVGIKPRSDKCFSNEKKMFILVTYGCYIPEVQKNKKNIFTPSGVMSITFISRHVTLTKKLGVFTIFQR